MTTGQVYPPSVTNRRSRRPRSTRAAMEQLRGQLYDLVHDSQPCTVRNVFYLGAGRFWDKDDRDLARVTRELGLMRERGDLPWEWITDSTRLVRVPEMWDSAEAALRETASFYRRNLWRSQPRTVEVWTESDSIGGVLHDVTGLMGVPLLASRGQSSKTFVHDAAMQYRRLGKPVTVLYVGDWDPGGLAIDLSVQERLTRYTDDAVDIDFRRIAVTAEQARVGDLISHPVKGKPPTMPTFEARCRAEGLPVRAIEAEAIPPRELRVLLRNELEAEITDRPAWETLKAAERSEKYLLSRISNADLLRAQGNGQGWTR